MWRRWRSSDRWMHVLDAAGKHDVGVRGDPNCHTAGKRRVVTGRAQGGIREFWMPGADTALEESARVGMSTRAIVWPVKC